MKLFKGKRKGVIHTKDITLDDIRAIFFPKNFHEKYRYLGSIPWNEEGDLFKVMEPLIIFMDYVHYIQLDRVYFMNILKMKI